MFTSNKRKLKLYSIMTLGAAVIGIIYEIFSYGVYSPYMYLMFLIPLLLGVLPICLANTLGKKFFSNKLSYTVYALSTCTLLVGSFLKGALDIYGTTSPWLIVYPILSIPMMMFAVATQLSTGKVYTGKIYNKNKIAIKGEAIK